MPAKLPTYLVPAPITIKEAGAIQALARGEAMPHQQVDILKWIVNQLCQTYDLSFSPEGDRETAFAEGRRFVGLQLVKMTVIDIEKLRKENPNAA